MAFVFPTNLFAFREQDVDIERQVLSGGVSVSGAEDKVLSDGGGRVYAQFTDGPLIDRETIMAWRAVTGRLDGGVTPAVVPFCDRRHQPYGTRVLSSVPYSDGTTHSDGTEFAAAGGAFADVTADAALRATRLIISAAALPRPLIGGEWFTIDHPDKGPRAYKVISIPDPGVVEFRPPLREAVAEGQSLDFENPRCLMVQDGATNSSVQIHRAGSAQIRFVEAP